MVNRYELLKCGKVLGIYTAKEIAGKLHCGISTVRAYACDGRKLNTQPVYGYGRNGKVCVGRL